MNTNEDKEKIINAVRKIVSNSLYRDMYKFDEEGNIAYYPNYFMEESNIKAFTDKEKRSYYEDYTKNYDGLLNLLDITEDEYNYLEHCDYNQETYNALMKQKMLKLLKEYYGDSVSDFDNSDVVPLDFRFNYLWNKIDQDKLYDSYDGPQKWYENDSFILKTYITDDMGTFIIDELYKLEDTFNNNQYLEYAIKVLNESRMVINVPNLTKEQILGLIKEYINENEINDDYTYSESIRYMNSIEDKEKIKKYLRNKYSKNIQNDELVTSKKSM